MIRGSDGLDYEDLAARLLGEPAKNRRNEILRSTHSAAFKAAYSEAWDRYKAEGYDELTCDRTAHAQACITAADAAGSRDDQLGACAYAYTHPHARYAYP